MAAKDKDTIYVDIDDEITGIIDKLRSSEGKVTALVLPKRAAVFQSIVNMKLLKRAADADKKHLVLITSEAGLLPLAGAAGVHVAKTLTSKPEIPAGPALDNDEDETIDQTAGEAEPEIDPSQPVGALAGAAAAKDGIETVVLDDDDLPPELDDKPAGSKTFVPPKGKKNKKLAVPNFDRFRLLLAAGALGLILLIAGLIFALTALPKATISIKTNATAVETDLGLKLSTAAKTLDPDDGTIPAKLAQAQKTFTQAVPTTGQKNNGNKASGSIKMSSRVCGSIPDGAPPSVPAGTGVSSNGLTYITQETTTFNDSGKVNGRCLVFESNEATDILAQSGGSNYNGANSFTVAGRSDVSATVASSITGGTDSIVRTVNQNDITNARAKIAANDGEVKKDLREQLEDDNFYVIEATFAAGTPQTTTSAAVGAVADTVTVTDTISYTMFGVAEKDLTTLIEDSVKDQIDTGQQTIIDNGLGKAVFNVDSQNAAGAQVTVATTATVGPDLDVNQIREMAAGKKAGAIKEEFKNNPDVTDVDVKLSPFWVSSVPKKTDKIKVEIAKPEKTVNAGSSE